MANRLFVLLILLNLLKVGAYAQTSQGNMMIGSLGSISLFALEPEKTLMADISPNIMVFVEEDLAVGGIVEMGFLRISGTRHQSLGIFPAARYYLGKPQMARVFLQAEGGYHYTSYLLENDGNSRTGLGIGGGSGIAIFFSPMVSLEGLAKVRAIQYTNNTHSAQLQLKLGVQLYLQPLKRF